MSTCLFSTDDPAFGGLGQGDAGPVKSQYIECHGREQAITLSLPHERRHLQVHPKVPVRRKNRQPRPRLQSPTRQPRRPQKTTASPRNLTLSS